MTLVDVLNGICGIAKRLGDEFFVKLEIDSIASDTYWLMLMRYDTIGRPLTVHCVSTMMIDTTIERMEESLTKQGIEFPIL